MEPADLNRPEPGDARWEAWLRQSAPPPLPDDGFTDRVLAALPPRRAPRPWPGWLIPSLGAAAGLAAMLLAGGGRDLEAAWNGCAGAVGGVLAGFADAQSGFEVALGVAIAAGLYAINQLVEE